VAASTQGVLRQVGSPLGLALIGALVFATSRSSLTGALGHLSLPGPAGKLAAGVNAKAGVLGVLESGLGAKIPPVGHAAVVALSDALSDGARVVAVICVVMAVIAAVALRRDALAARAETADSAA
jgi:hypothetical protein